MIIHENKGRKIGNIIEENKNVILDFWASWCGPCLELGEVLKELDAKHGKNITILKIDADKVNFDKIAETLKKYEKNNGSGSSVEKSFQRGSIPLLMFFNGGKMVNKIIDVAFPKTRGVSIGFMKLPSLEEILEKIGWIPNEEEKNIYYHLLKTLQNNKFPDNVFDILKEKGIQLPDLIKFFDKELEREKFPLNCPKKSDIPFESVKRLLKIYKIDFVIKYFPEHTDAIKEFSKKKNG